MRKIIYIILAVMVLLGSLAVRSSFAVIATSPDYRIKTAVWAGESGPTSTNSITLTSANRIIGVRVVGSSNPVAGLYDTSNVVTASKALLIDEPAAASNSESMTWYPAPKNITTGLTVLVSATTTNVIVFYE